MSVLNSVLYAAASVVLLAVILECCCGRRLKRLRESPHALALSVVNDGQRQVVTSYQPGVTLYPRAVVCTPGVAHPVATYPMPIQIPLNNTAYYVASYPPPVVNNPQQLEAPPPTYEQAMASERASAPQR